MGRRIIRSRDRIDTLADDLPVFNNDRAKWPSGVAADILSCKPDGPLHEVFFYRHSVYDL
jgi:hypothetical protein